MSQLKKYNDCTINLFSSELLLFQSCFHSAAKPQALPTTLQEPKQPKPKRKPQVTLSWLIHTVLHFVHLHDRLGGIRSDSSQANSTLMDAFQRYLKTELAALAETDPEKTPRERLQMARRKRKAQNISERFESQFSTSPNGWNVYEHWISLSYSEF